MPHFIVEVIYKAPLEKIDEALEEHREFLQDGYDRGILLMSGPQLPRTGGIIIARANSMEELAAYISGDPFNKKGLADYQYIQFDPVKHQEFLKNWL
jgi:uncharacterized protein YciI